MDEAAETGPMKMDGGKTREIELLFSRLPISRNCRDVMFTEWENAYWELCFRGWGAGNGTKCSSLGGKGDSGYICFAHSIRLAYTYLHVFPGSK